MFEKSGFAALFFMPQRKLNGDGNLYYRKQDINCPKIFYMVIIDMQYISNI